MKVARAFVVLALCLSIGLHWIALQSIAWTTMIVEYSQDAPLAKALAETFDGSRPCDLCKHIDQARHSEKKPDAQPTSGKPDLICVKRTVVLSPPYTYLSFPVERMSAATEAPLPAVPPPRIAPA